MTDKASLKVGMRVYFGRANGERTIGEIVKLNPAKAQVKQLEQRGNHPSGTVWSVPYSLITVARGEREPLKYDILSDDNDLLACLLRVYVDLSPENLSCDGLVRSTHIRERRMVLERKRRGLHIALGYEPDEAELYEWEQQRRRATEG